MGPKRGKGLCLGCMERREGLICPHCGWDHENPPSSPPHLAPGTTIADNYILGRVLGAGGFGITYLSWDSTLNRKLAIKEYFPAGIAHRAPDGQSVVAPGAEMTAEFEYGLKRFLQEGQSLAKFDSNPVIVSVKNFVRENNTSYLLMNYEEGVTLEKYLIENGGRIDFEQALAITLPIMDALTDVHQKGVLHRDISPDNIFITKSKRPKLLDFGAAKRDMSSRAASSIMIFKQGFSPVEQYTFEGEQGPWTDVYAMAATLYRAITGNVPPPAIDRAVRDTIVWPSRLGVEIAPAAESALSKALAVKARNRYQKMADLKNAISVPKRRLRPDPSPLGLYALRATAVLALLAFGFLLYRAFWQSGGAELQPTPSLIEVVAQSDGRQPEPATVKWNGPSIAFSAYATAPWLSVSPERGSKLESMVVRFNTFGLTPGVYFAEIRVSSSDPAITRGPGIVKIRLTKNPEVESRPKPTSATVQLEYVARQKLPSEVITLPNRSKLSYEVRPNVNWLRVQINANHITVFLTRAASVVNANPHRTAIYVTPADSSEPAAVISVNLKVPEEPGASRVGEIKSAAGSKNAQPGATSGGAPSAGGTPGATTGAIVTGSNKPQPTDSQGPPAPCNAQGALKKGKISASPNLRPYESVEILTDESRNLTARRLDATGAVVGEVSLMGSPDPLPGCPVTVKVQPADRFTVDQPTRDTGFRRLVVRKIGSSPAGNFSIFWELQTAN